MNVIRAKKILRETTIALSKGEQTEYFLGVLGVPKALRSVLPSEEDLSRPCTVVDCQILSVGVYDAPALRSMREFTELLRGYPNKLELSQGVSYQHLAAVLGDEVAALQFCALGHVLGLWSVVLPGDLGVTDFPDEAAVLGWVYITGYPQLYSIEAAG
jgi:hypothetical protein